MYKHLANLVALFAVFSLARAEEDQELQIFNNDSLFMQGFENGYLLKKREQVVEDFGCYVPMNLKLANDRAANAYDIVKRGFEGAKNTLDLNPVIDEAINMILIKIDGLYKFIAVLSPHNEIDEYCTGMIFGMYGSNGMLKMANRMINPQLFYDNAQTRFGNYKKYQEDRGTFRKRMGKKMRNRVSNFVNTASKYQ